MYTPSSVKCTTRTAIEFYICRYHTRQYPDEKEIAKIPSWSFTIERCASVPHVQGFWRILDGAINKVIFNSAGCLYRPNHKKPVLDIGGLPYELIMVIDRPYVNITYIVVFDGLANKVFYYFAAWQFVCCLNSWTTPTFKRNSKYVH